MYSKINVAVCDDNSEILNEETKLIKSVLDTKKIEYEVSSFRTPIEMLDSGKVFDIAFLDVELGDTDGISIAKTLHHKNAKCLIFFVTNHEAYMDKALNEHAFRFWTKPINKDRLIYGIDSALKEIENNNINITVNVNSRDVDIEAKSIVYIYVKDRKIHIVTTRGEIETRGAFRTITAPLNKCGYFYDCHASYYVNFNYVKSYDHTSIVCSCDDKEYDVYISRRKYTAFHEKFIEWLGGK